MFLLSVQSNRKVTSGITEWCRASVQSDHDACFFDVGFTYPGGAQAPKGAGVRQIESSIDSFEHIPIKRYHELGLQRCEAVGMISIRSVSDLKRRHS